MDQLLNLPNLLTGIRLACIPVLVGLFYVPIEHHQRLAALTFLIASATDFIDGYLARRRSQITNLGKLLDPVADKLLVMAALLLLVEAGKLWAWVAILIIGREIAVTGLRAMASTRGVVMAAEGMGKFKMLFQVIGITFLFLTDSSGHNTLWMIGCTSLAAAVLLALISGGQYAIRAGHLLLSPHKSGP
ncbi:MAG TPA: CDP-diacylglycerol--glycerol-3-phosphate 3-phosphatidyltransferase [Nitrospiria bacterium]|nr:CDP-diacylglycerol--glycerol-3-phosphate 3-phosphatidyltransferase [Nitrospiria bacterium]